MPFRWTSSSIRRATSIGQDDMPKRWRIHPHDSDRIAALARSARVPMVVARLLLCRGLDEPQRARGFLDARLSDLRDPDQLPGAVDAAGRIWRAIQEGRRIVIYGDYDVDGMTATSLLWQCLTMLGADVGYYVPHRIDEGYGLNCDALSTLASQNAKLVVTVDCGIGSVTEANFARDLGLDLIVTDHHEPGERLPDAVAIVHPHLPGREYSFAGLSGVGVAFKLAWAICQQASQAKKVSQRMRDFLLSAIGLAALGTVADMVPLVDENRVLVQHGLTSLKERPGLGLGALLKLAELHRKQRLESEDIAFALAPRLNAAGRLGQAQLAVELLTTTSPERATLLAEYINELNGSRQSLERSIYLAAHKQALDQFDPERDPALVLADHGWHPGVIGIVAGRLVEKFHRPVVMIALDETGVKPGVGSARSVPGFNLYHAMRACARHLLGHGGHAAAAGLRIDEKQIDAFRADFCDYAASEISQELRVAELSIDAEVSLAELTLSAIEQLQRMAPFGNANPRPLLCASGVTLTEPPKRIGGGGRHLSLKLLQHNTRLRAVAFGGGDWADELGQLNRPMAIAFRPVINEFGGRKNVELHLADWRATLEVSAVGS
jgi:single-stranded-DNA-specific exonuclease